MYSDCTLTHMRYARIGSKGNNNFWIRPQQIEIFFFAAVS